MMEFDRFDCAKCKKNTLSPEDRAKGFINCEQDFARVIYWCNQYCYCRSYEEANK